MIELLIILAGLFFLLDGAFSLFDLTQGSFDPAFTFPVIIIGAVMFFIGLRLRKRRHEVFTKHIHEFSGGKEALYVPANLMSNRLGLLFTRYRAVTYANGKLALISSRGKITEIPTTSDVKIQLQEPYLIITTPERVYVLSDVNIWKMWLLPLGISGIVRSFEGGTGILSSIAGAAAAENEASKHLGSFTQLQEELQGTLRVASADDFQKATLDYKAISAILWVAAITFTAVILLMDFTRIFDEDGTYSGLTKENKTTTSVVWFVVFALGFLWIRYWRKKHQVEPSIDKAFRRPHDNQGLKEPVETSNKSVNFLLTTISIPFKRRTRIIITLGCLLVAVGTLVYANKFEKNAQYEPISVVVYSQNYTNCSLDFNSPRNYCVVTVTGETVDGGKPFKWSGELAHPTQNVQNGSIKQYWVYKNTSDYSNLHDLDVRDGQPIKDSWTTPLYFIAFFIAIIFLVLSIAS